MSSQSGIVIKHYLDEVVYRGIGGGETGICARYKATPRNLLRACNKANYLSATLYRGHELQRRTGRVFIEIDGIEIDSFSLRDVWQRDMKGIGFMTQTAKAAQVIADVQSGEYTRLYNEIAAAC